MCKTLHHQDRRRPRIGLARAGGIVIKSAPLALGKNMTYEPDANKSKIRDFVLEYAREQNITSLADDESVLTTKAIDSLGVFRVIAFMEETFPITIEDTDLLPENFETINLMAAFVGRKLAGDGADIMPAVSPDEAKPVPTMA